MSGRRIIITCLLLGLLVWLCIGFGVSVQEADESRSSGVLASDYEEQIGTQVHLWGQVQSLDPLVVTSGDVRLTVTGPKTDAAPGDLIQVYGTVKPGHRIAAHRVVVSDETGRQRMFAVSLLAPFLAMVIAWRRWTVRATDWSLLPRDA